MGGRPGILVGLLEADPLEKEGDGLVAVYFKPVGTDEILLVENCVVGAQKPKILKLKKSKGKIFEYLCKDPAVLQDVYI